MKNPVAKYMNEYNKPKVERDRKANPSKKQKAAELAERLHDKELADRLAPYDRASRRNFLLEWDEEDRLMLEDDYPEYGEEYE